MSTARVRKQVESILNGNGLPWEGDAENLSLRFDSALVTASFLQWGSQVIIQLRAMVLSELGMSIAQAATKRVNDLNCSTILGKWAYYEADGIVALEYDLLGDFLQEAELMTALAAVARLADRQDDILQTELGGSKAFEK